MQHFIGFMVRCIILVDVGKWYPCSPGDIPWAIPPSTGWRQGRVCRGRGCIRRTITHRGDGPQGHSNFYGPSAPRSTNYFSPVRLTQVGSAPAGSLFVGKLPWSWLKLLCLQPLLRFSGRLWAWALCNAWFLFQFMTSWCIYNGMSSLRTSSQLNYHFPFFPQTVQRLCPSWQASGMRRASQEGGGENVRHRRMVEARPRPMVMCTERAPFLPIKCMHTKFVLVFFLPRLVGGVR
jgi:hypothetical protein